MTPWCFQGTSPPDGFDAAVEFIEQLSRQLTYRTILVVPGNHDIDRSTPVAIKELSLPTPQEEAEERFRAFLGRLKRFDGQINEHLSMVTRVERRGRNGLVLVGLNSSRVERSDTRGWGYVGADQTGAVGRALLDAKRGDRAKEGDWVVAIMHHNPLPVVDVGLQVLSGTPDRRKFSFVMDAGRTLSFLADLGIGLLLHGHTHVRSNKRVEGYGTVDLWDTKNSYLDSTFILGAGSLGDVTKLHAVRANDPLHHFQVIELDSDQQLLSCLDLTCPSYDRGKPRKWNLKKTGGRVYGNFWNPERAEKALALREVQSLEAARHYEIMQSWSVLRAKKLQQDTWPSVLAALHDRVCTTAAPLQVRPPELDRVTEVVEDIFEHPPTEYDMSEWTLEPSYRVTGFCECVDFTLVL